MSAVTYQEDAVVFPAMVELLAAFETQVRERRLPGFCFSGLLPGGEVAYDYCGGGSAGCGCVNGKQGQAWVRLVSTYVTSSPPAQDAGAANCGAAQVYQLELGAARCAPQMDDAGNPPSADDQLAATRLQMADMAAMRAAILCTFKALHDDGRAVQVGSYLPIVQSGGCTGGVWQITVW